MMLLIKKIKSEPIDSLVCRPSLPPSLILYVFYLKSKHIYYYVFAYNIRIIVYITFVIKTHLIGSTTSVQSQASRRISCIYFTSLRKQGTPENQSEIGI